MTDAVALAECPVGLFWHDDTLCLKTEYGNNEGRIDAYIVESGEFFWGAHPQTIANQRAQLVVPVDMTLASLRRSKVTASAVLAEREACAELVENWNGATRIGDTQFIAEAIRSRSAPEAQR